MLRPPNPLRGRISRERPSRPGWLVGIGVVVGSVVAISACGSSGGPPAGSSVCSPGASRSCAPSATCAGGGVSACSGDPPGWEPCRCAGAHDAGADASVEAEAGAAPSLGRACKADTECPVGAFCLATRAGSLFGGAPATGTCVAPCAGGATCPGFSGAVCVSVADPAGTMTDAGEDALCFEGCTLGGAEMSKCHGAEHVACTPLDTGAGYCRPVCAVDSDCPAGSCDPRRAVCVPGASLDPTFGLACTLPGNTGTAVEAGSPLADAGAFADAGDGNGAVEAAGADSASDGGAPSGACDGICVALGKTSALCSRRCVFGSATECAPASGGLRRGACLLVTTGGGLGDLGYCGELCDCSNDCSDPSFVCDAFVDATLEQAFGRKGACTPPDLVQQHAIACGD